VAGGAGDAGSVRKDFFFEKKKQKTFIHWIRDHIKIGPRGLMSKSFLVLFFKKEQLPS
jgi:hypothetical protein